MKLKAILIAFIATFILSACNLSLAQDITPPPGYKPPAPAPTLGPLFPAQAPSTDRGAAIYAEKCAACHGLTGLGDGAQGKELPVSVAALGLPQVARLASPADWFTMVSRGNIERFMPPFVSLSDQERWDVVAYAQSLHTTPEQIALGQNIIETNCVNCALNFFTDQTEMSALSDDELVALLKNGSDKVTALNGNLSDDDLYAVAAYLRTLTFASESASEAATATVTPSPVEATPAATETTSAEGTPLITAASPTLVPETAGGNVTGSVVGANASGLTVTLRGFDHAQDQSTGPEEIVTLESTVGADGTFTFAGVELIEGRIFVAEVTYQKVKYGSELVFVEAGRSEIAISPFTIYETSTDLSVIRFDQVHIFFDISGGTVQVIAVYTFSNRGDTALAVESLTEIPFIKTPENVQNLGFDVTQDSAPLLETENGFAMPPSETAYGFVSFYTLPYASGVNISQPFTQNVDALLVLVPDGVKVKSEQLVEGQVQNFNGTNYREYTSKALAADSTLTVQLSGVPKGARGTLSNAGVLLGVGLLGLAFVAAGVWMYMHDRKRNDEEAADDEPEDEFESQEDLLDAIIALDDLHRAGKMQDDAYQLRRAELKARLKDERKQVNRDTRN